ncbi:tRNA preQ1(34) S-adenosylmethionine ribosyltransferase-isomerase QueA [Oleidesulfovibrio alaskensis]|jgi:S-adenosylmethionine:tRNA ribosyltransferase-isomerase|uniref:tRNA preQ1(34) S-adenosylmethionine ribosyltransferase-isomerase QueA n=1 Tax=Oleidesulfovibrio alaskensis TaxID=58180 RepID=UPI001A554E7C|nr:tRNA preQ1(34) S-adenosylmethionine ribosyltransferase-isomerase QueA [Oleidesulfovibrio alaskensis]MBL3583484.1 tRNA preQ1(34) S-adenosylmethionine ribosyltransferase-isomerase QueA [Oleidesulfovibrio alaskensis]
MHSKHPTDTARRCEAGTDSSDTAADDYSLAGYRFELPEEQIAQHPPEHRGASRLFVMDRKSGVNTQASFKDIGSFLPEGALLVANNSRVLPARMLGRRPTGGKVEFLLLTPLPLVQPQTGTDGRSCAEAEGLLRASKRVRPGDVMHFDGLDVEVLHTADFGRCAVRMHWKGDLAGLFLRQGHLPLPPYIRRPDGEDDHSRYQTVYSRQDRLGSVAAPTAGLHFTPELTASLQEQGFGWAEVTLYVGYGTFSPVRAEDIRTHTMHREYMEITEQAAQAINDAKRQGRPVVTVGTTSTRVLEGAWAACGEIRPFTGWTDIFIYPGYRFNVADHIITNFHLPESSLLMMISAFAGREKTLQAYSQAVAAGYRFFSYGDAMLIL